MQLVDQRRFSRQLFSAVAMPVVALALLAGLLSWLVAHLVSVSQWVDHTDRVIAQARAVERRMIDMETGARGYLLSGDSQFLEPWTDGRRNVGDALEVLQDLVADNPPQENRITAIRSALASWMAAEQTTIDVRDEDVAHMAKRKSMMDDLRAQMATVIRTEEGLRAVRVRTTEGTTALTLGGALASTLVFGVFIGLFTRRRLLRVADLYGESLSKHEVLLEHANEGIRARDHVLSIASHELRTPLTSLKMQAELLLKMSEREDRDLARDEVYRRADACKRQVDRLEIVVDQLLDADSVRASRVTVRREHASLAQILRDCIQELSPRADAAGCKVALELDEPTMGAWDREKVRSIVHNLVTNALEFGRGKPIDVSLRDEGATASFFVRDRGAGVPEEDRERIFRPLEDPDITHHAHGLGLGLYIARGLAQAMGGNVTVVGTEGPGATFRVALPK